MSLAPFAPRPVPPALEARRARLAVFAALVGIGAALIAYAIAPGVRHAITHAEGSVRHAVTKAVDKAVDKVFPDQHAAPALPATVLAGSAVDVHSLKGHPALVAFWSSTCAACASEAGSLRAVADSGDRVVGIDYGGTLAGAQQFVHHHRLTFPNLRDATGAVGRKYGVKSAAALPVVYVLNSGGDIVKTLHGPQTAAGLAAALRAGGKPTA